MLAEYTPGVAERHRQWQLMGSYPASLQAVAGAGYRIWHLGGCATKNALPGCAECVRGSGCACAWASLKLPPLREVSAASLRAEARPPPATISPASPASFALL